METWVLVLISLVNSQPVGITSVPGYSSFEECEKVGRDFEQRENAGSSHQHARQADYHCLLGPKK
jgi:hypothetical protein